MMVKKTKDHMLFDSRAPAKITKMGNITDLVVCDTISKEPSCKKVSKDNYVNTKTGEIFDYKHVLNRSQCYESIRKTMRKIRELINSNVTNIYHVRWITLTYKENMTDREQLYKDYDKFWKKFTYYLKLNGIEKPEYITVVEPQGRGAWHIHGLFIWNETAPFVANDVLAQIWGHGFVSIKQPKDCDNLGAYFTAYLANMTVEDIDRLTEKEKAKAFAAASMAGDINPVQVTTVDGKSKRVIKGARLAMYPPGMNIFRHSKGVKKPEVIRTTYAKAVETLAESKVTYTQSFEIVDENGNCRNRILKASYNSKRK